MRLPSHLRRGDRNRGGGHERKSDRAPPRETAQEGCDTRKRAGSQNEVALEEELGQVKLKLARAEAGFEASRRPENRTRTRNVIKQGAKMNKGQPGFSKFFN